jgi:peptidoglycan/LPS O-acetylase OafA/YrhL
MNTHSGARFQHIDAIRAIAAVLVIIMHCSDTALGSPAFMSTGGSWLSWVANTFDFGRLGVMLFFAVSGFVIPSSLKPGQHPGVFWVRRFFRLYPVYWLSVALAVCVQAWLWHHYFAAPQVAANLTMLQNFLRYENVEGVYWTLKLELVFYVACYLLFLTRMLENTILLEVISLGLATIFVCYLDLWNGPLGFARHLLNFTDQTRSALDAQGAANTAAAHPLPGLLNMNWGYFCAYFSLMFLGAILRRLYDRRLSGVARSIALLLPALWITILSVMGLFAYRATHDLGMIGVFAPATLAVLLFVVLAFRIRITSRYMALMGVISYSLYLMHPIVIDTLVAIQHSSSANLPVFTLVVLVLTILLSIASYRLVERPSIRKGHELANRLERKASLKAAMPIVEKK